MVKKIYKVNGMDCSACATALEVDLEDLGVVAKCSYATQKLEVEFDPEKTQESQIKEIVSESGFTIS